MDNPYKTQASDALTSFEFVSIGPKGSIKKIVHYEKMKADNSWNLGFGDEDPQTGLLDDIIVSDNHDSQKVLETVASTLLIFLENHPGATVFVAGSTKSRTRLYQIAVSKKLESIQRIFTIWGFVDGDWKHFEKGTNYEAFMVRKNVITLKS